MKLKYQVIILASILLSLIFFQCTNNVESNPDPGVLRIYLVTNQADTCIQMGFDSLTIINSDKFPLTITQMKAYTDEINYAQLFKDFEGYKDEDIEYNLFEREQDRFIPQKIVETYIPPNSYERVEFVVDTSGYVTIQGLAFPIETPDDYDPLISFDHNFTIDENQEYDIYIQFNAFQSITRWRDIYIFTKNFEIINN